MDHTFFSTIGPGGGRQATCKCGWEGPEVMVGRVQQYWTEHFMQAEQEKEGE